MGGLTFEEAMARGQEPFTGGDISFEHVKTDSGEIKTKRNKPGRRKTDFAKACGHEVLCRAEIEERKPEPVEQITPDLQVFVEYEQEKDKRSGFTFWSIALAEIVAIVVLSLL